MPKNKKKKNKGGKRDGSGDHYPSRTGSTTTSNTPRQLQESEAQGSCAVLQSEQGNTTHEKHTVKIQQIINAKNVQVGSGNVINEQSQEDDNSGDDGSTSNGAMSERSYSQVVSRETKPKQLHTTINANTVTNVTNVIQANPQIPRDTGIQEDESTVRKYTRSQQKQLLEAVSDFKKGHFGLLVGQQDINLKTADPLAYIRWTVILDFDPNGEICGLFSRLHADMSKLRSFHYDNVKDALPNKISDETTNWLFVRGLNKQTDSGEQAFDLSNWRKTVYADLDSKLAIFNEFNASTKFCFLVVWPKDDIEAACMQFVLDKILLTFNAVQIVIITDHNKHSNRLECLKSEEAVKVLELSFFDLCHAFLSVSKPITQNTPNKYTLPTKDNKAFVISDQQYHLLNENLDVLYEENKTAEGYTGEMIEAELEQFYKGATLSWNFWYAVNAGHADIQRDIFKDVMEHMRYILTEKKESELVTLLHDPGGGGTTLAQRVLWDLKATTPCVQVKHRYFEESLVEKLELLSDKTDLPIVVMIDGEPEHKIKSLLVHVKESDIKIVILYVRRRNIKDETDHGKGTFILQGKLSKNEANVLKLKKNPYLKNPRRRKNVEKLVQAVANGKSRTIFEFGLAAHSYEYQGIHAYVEGHFKVSENDQYKLQDWQLALAYLSLVYYYGHSSMPSRIFTSLLSKDGYRPILEIADFPNEMHEFLVLSLNEASKYFVRISHYYVAKEILQKTLLILANCKTQVSDVSPFLCKKAKRILGEFSRRFIAYVKKETGSSLNGDLTRMLVSTFIARENQDLLEEDDTTPIRRNRRQKFAPILEDASDSAPYTCRFDIYKTLADSFPREPQFRAHLGRLYQICRPEELTNAENNLKMAYELIKPKLDKSNSAPKLSNYDRFCIRNICHMYGRMLSMKVFKYTGRSYLSTPDIKTSRDEFERRAEEILEQVKTACMLYDWCRVMTAPGHEQCVGYSDEIQLRLMYCKFVTVNTGNSVIDEYLATTSGIVADFVEDCYTALNVLFDELYDQVHAMDMHQNVQSLHGVYFDLFRPKCYLREMKLEDTPAKRRIEIGKLKRKFENKRNRGEYLPKLTDPADIRYIVETCEENFKSDENFDPGLDGDYREWIRAIRHPRFEEEYPLDKVYDRIKEWHEHVIRWNNIEKQTVARFYMFVVASVIGFGTVDTPGNQELLRQSQILKGEFRQHKKFSRNGDSRREFLGAASDKIRRLVPSNTLRRTGKDVAEKDLIKLEMRTGKICAPNTNPSSGYIELDIGPENKEHIRVFYIPELWGLKGSSYRKQRVQFVLEFNMVHGYEAYNVNPLRQTDCCGPDCGNKIMCRSIDTLVSCPRCGTKTEVD